ncbi:tandem-type lipoprotein [Staphylococcus pettenkoferi]|uniref:Tandem-type lipoprotein n=1 Tax=Staphylococcus pettenkoferi TaxID=170573 RepID=A0A2N6QFN5_9STAP|nr:tandem-type lipoprotein [Staphylococcus pettenkoferi]
MKPIDIYNKHVSESIEKIISEKESEGGKILLQLNKTIVIGLCIISLLFIGSCGRNDSSKLDSEIDKNMHRSLSIYPTKNLEEFYDIDGVRNRDFKKGDKGKWILDSSINTKKDNELKSEGAVLYIDRNKRTARGYYYINKFKDNGKKNEKHYPIEMKENNLIPSGKNVNVNTREKIKKFNFFVQYTDVNSSIENKKGKNAYNYNLPKFVSEYKMSDKDALIKSLKSKYKIPYEKATMQIIGRSKPKSSSLGNKEIKVNFKKNKYYFQDSIDFQPTKQSEK